MIKPEWMAVALLVVSWVTGGMVVLDALIDVRAWLRRKAQWRSGLLTGTARATLGSLSVEQRARLFDDGNIGFFERSHRSVVTGGALDVSGEVLEVTAAPDAEVWVPHAELVARGACSSAVEFSRLATDAKGRGSLRTVTVELAGGSRVWVAGAREGSRVTATLVSSVDPHAEARWRLLLNVGLIVLNVAWVVVGSVLALWPPAFGTVSIVGACVLFGHLLGITPLAVKVRELSRTPAHRELLGEWRRAAVSSVQPVTS